nr:protein RMD5 homolog A [Onthophagus taurus]
MEACCAVEKEVDKILSKFESIGEHANRTLGELVQYIQSLKHQIDNAPSNHELTPIQVDTLKQATIKVKETISMLSADHKDLHATVSRVGKVIDKHFIQDFAGATKEDSFNTPQKIELLNKIICQHFYRQGMKDVAQELAKESSVEVELNENEPFTELNHILESLREKNLQPALDWAVTHRENLEAQNSSLEFQLHRLKYIEILRNGSANETEAINYARTFFKPFAYKHEKEIQTLMGMMLYVRNDINRSPYSCLLDPDRWMDVYDIFTKDACSLLGVSVNSPLSTCVNAGCKAIPALLNIKHIMKERQVAAIWNGKDELPIEIDLGNDSRYHSMFACPILRQQSTENNPPMRLICGHVISRDALNKLCSGNKMKCPYCPMEQSPTDARLIFF